MEKHNEQDWLVGGGEMGKLIRSMDWSQNSLGPIEKWPQSLRTSVSLCLSSTFPINIVWGPDHIQIYNDAYRPICGALHPGSMGSKFKELWAAALPVVGGAFDRALQGEGTYIENQRMMLERFGYLEEAFMTFSFSPIRDESGGVGGNFHPITESTEKMLSSRRSQIIRDLAIQVSTAKSLLEVYDLTKTFYSSFELDVPFLLFYERDSHGDIHLKDAVGIKDAGNGSIIDPNGKGWELFAADASTDVLRVLNLQERFGHFVSGPYTEMPSEAVVIPVRTPGSDTPTFYAVAGVSARRAQDNDYLSFYSMLQNTFANITGNIWAYEEEQKKAQALAEIDKAKTAFFSNVSHEFRTPLTLIMGPLEDSLRDDNDPLSEEHKKRLDVVHRNSTRLLKLVNSLLDFSRIEAGRIQASFTPVELSKFTADLASLFRSTIEKVGLTLDIDCEPLPESIYIDKEMWEKIVLNLISNAFKFTFEGSIKVQTRWTGKEAQLIIKDSGIGISAEELPRLFERFHRVQGAKSRTYEGTGIGLALVQELVNIHGGQISATSTEGVGTTFTITLQAGKSHIPHDRIGAVNDLESTAISSNAFLKEAQMWIPSDKTQQKPESQSKSLVLLADDNLDMRLYVESILSQHWRVITAENGEEAFKLAQKYHPDLILTDVMMPVLDGFGLLQKIRNDDELKTTQVVLLSARAGEEAKVEGLAAGADDYLTKPFSAKELVSRLSALLTMDRVRYESSEELKASADKFRSMFSHATVNIAMVDLNGHILEVNEAFLNRSGFSSDEIVGKHFSVITHPEDVDKNIETIQNLASGKINAATFEKRYVKKDGGQFWVQTSLSTYFGHDGKPLYLIAISQDIEAIKKAESRYVKANQDLLEEKDIRERFVATLTHDLRSPLTAAKFSAQMILRKPEFNDVIINHANRVVSNIGRADQMIDDLLDASRIKAGEKLPLDISEFDLALLVEDTLTNLATINGDRYIVEAAEKNIIGEWDNNEIRRVIENLANNAIKYGDAHTPVTVSLKSNHSHVEIGVHNQGNPINIEDQIRIFDPYKRTNSAIHEKKHGWGLGLTLVRGVVEAHEGELKLFSSAEAGTTFTVKLPRKSCQLI